MVKKKLKALRKKKITRHKIASGCIPGIVVICLLPLKNGYILSIWISNKIIKYFVKYTDIFRVNQSGCLQHTYIFLKLITIFLCIKEETNELAEVGMIKQLTMISGFFCCCPKTQTEQTMGNNIFSTKM